MTRRRAIVEAKPTGIRGLAYGRVRFEAVIPHGKKHRTVAMDMSVDVILKLADCVRGCQRVYEISSSGERPHSMDEVAANPKFVSTWIGHAVWHLEHPDALMPCLPYGTKVIDVPTVPLLTENNEPEPPRG